MSARSLFTAISLVILLTQSGVAQVRKGNAPAGVPGIVFKASKVTSANRPTFIKLFEEAKRLEALPKAKSKYKVLERVREGNYVCTPIEESAKTNKGATTTTTNRRPTINRGPFGPNNRPGIPRAPRSPFGTGTTTVVDEPQPVLLRLLKEKDGGFVKGDVAEVVTEKGGVEEVKRGEKKERLRVYAEAGPPKELTRTAFVSLLKLGKVYDLSIPVNCNSCQGFGRVSTRRKGSKDGKEPCRVCKGKGKVMSRYSLSW